MKFLIIFGFVIGVVACEITERECVKNFVNHVEVTVNEDAQICENIFKNFTVEFTDDITSRLRPDDDKACILNKFDVYKISTVYLRGLIGHLHNGTATSEDYEDDVDESKHALINAVKVLCVAHDKYGEKFNTDFYSAKSEDKPDVNTMMCIKKYLFEHNIINPADYNIDTSTVNAAHGCEETHKDLKDTFAMTDDKGDEPNTFFGLSASKALDCASRKFKSEKVFEKLYSFHVIIDFDLNVDQVNKLRDDFIKWNTSSVRFLLECIEEI